jgi:pimeloyl-ACP methyl ester carboxylesterase
MPTTLDTPQGRRIAYAATAGAGPGVMFLGGFRSDMTGTKAQTLEAWARREGRAFVRFDYSGHGASGGAFEDGCIGDWAEDAAAVLATVEGPQVLVGSSMGGWIALLLARDRPDRVAGLVGIAAAPDFTDHMASVFTDMQRAEIAATGRTTRPSDYGAPYVVTRRLIEDGRARAVLASPLPLAMPVRLLQGTADADVDVSRALRLLDHIEGADATLTLVKGADHRFSDRACLAMIAGAIGEVTSGATTQI